MKKIGIFTGFFLPHLGGVERYTDKLVEQLKKLGYEIIIITSNDNNYQDYEKLDNYAIYRLPVFSLIKQRYPLLKKNNKYKNIVEKIKKENCDYYICNTRFYLTSLLCAKIAKSKKKKFLVIEHGSDHFTVNNKILDFFGAKYEHFITNKIKKYNPEFYGVSKRCNVWLKHFNIKASGIFYNSVDDKAYDEFKSSKYKRNFKNKIVISFVGRIIKEKGILLLLDAFKELSNNYKNIVLVVAGNGPLLDEVKKIYNDKNIFFEGKLNYNDVMALYNRTDIFVNPSMYPEGLPTSILEAGIMKSAIIATNRGGTIEVINDKKYGIIIDENKEALKEALEELLCNPELINKLKNNVHKRIIKNFTWKETAKIVAKELEKDE